MSNVRCKECGEYVNGAGYCSNPRCALSDERFNKKQITTMPTESKTTTPRTDAELKAQRPKNESFVLWAGRGWDFARQLETELSEATAARQISEISWRDMANQKNSVVVERDNLKAEVELLRKDAAYCNFSKQELDEQRVYAVKENEQLRKELEAWQKQVPNVIKSKEKEVSIEPQPFCHQHQEG